jgi:hypothetical protein
MGSVRRESPTLHPFFTPPTVKAILSWYDAGAGSGSHLAARLGVAPSQEIRALANILACAKESAEVQKMLGDLCE